MTDLNELINLQRKLQIDSYGSDPAELSGEEKIQFIHWNVTALVDELHEALGEVGWKPWAKSRHINENEYKNELIDALHFLMNLCIVVNMDGDEVAERYKAKRLKNAQRQVEGYDGVTNKCSKCKRALDDVPPKYSKKLCGICELAWPEE